MTLRPHPARWFEVLTDREHLGAVLRCLAATQAVELETRSAMHATATLPDYREVLAGYEELARRHAPYWPEPATDPTLPPPDSVAGARDALAELRAWAEDADGEVARLQALSLERARFAELASVLRDAGDAFPAPAALGSAGPTLASRLYALDAGTVVEVPAAVMTLPLDGSAHGAAPARRYLLAVGGHDDVAQLDAALSAAHARVLTWPPGLPPGVTAAADVLAARLATLDGEIAAARSRLDAISARHRLPGRLAGFRFLDWLVRHVPRLPATEHFAYVTGWTDDLDDARLGPALASAKLPHLLHFPEAPRTLHAPTVLRNARWAQPFEAFVRLLGTPGATEADPTPIVAIVAPLLFGFMFGDVGHGLVITAAGLLLRRRYPALRLLISGGLVATAFGFAFGTVFALEHVIPPLWLHPLDEPLTLLAASVALGVLLIGGGFVLDFLQHAWRGEAARWLELRGGLLALYSGLVLAPLRIEALAIAAVGAVWYVAGAIHVERDLRAAGAALGELAETTLQLLVNTVSFARVGAFALAHAGRSAAIVGLAQSAGGGIGFVALLVFGNVLILVVEGMVVGIQTTRLVLFEFFIRFLRADGRPFRPLPDPAAPPAGATVPRSAP
jgi:V/A-type H+-transporting ATPase subunit I